MKAAATTLPPRRIPTARLERMRAQAAAAAQARESAYQVRQDELAQLVSPTPEFAPALRLTMLPGGLAWTAKQVPVPAIGDTVMVSRDGHRQAVMVAAYCHAAGFLGLVTEPEKPAKPARRKANPRANVVFSYQLAQAA